ncbi:MAG TPA: hypothetical protein VJC04_03090 [Candidatus Paceibacterota bacterium]
MNLFAKTSRYQKLLTILALGSVFLLPISVGAAITDLKSLATSIIEIINLIQKFLVALSVFIIIWGIFRYLIVSDDKERLTKAKDVIVYGLLGIVIMYSIVGIIALLLSTLAFDKTNLPPIPQLTRNNLFAIK